MSQYTYAKNRQAIRKTEFKKGIEQSEARKKREENTVQIRKKNREQSFQKRRNVSSTDETLLVANHLHALVEMVKTNDLQVVIEATTAIRKLLSQDENPPIQEIIDTGVTIWLVEFLKQNESPKLQFEAAWALTNIASGSSQQTLLVIECNAIPAFRDLLFCPNNEVREQAAWALGNIAGDSVECRDYVLSNDVMGPLLQNINELATLTMLRNATWTLSNLCRCKPQPPPWDLVKPALPTLAKLLFTNDDEVLADACWAICYLSDGPEERIQTVIEAGVVRKLVELLLHSSYSIQTPALRAIGNILTGSDYQTQVVVNASGLNSLSQLLYSPKKGIRKEACWAISNITAGNRAQIQAVFQAQIIPRLIQLIKSSEFDTKREGIFALSNATSRASYQQIQYLVEQNVIETFCDLLSCSDTRLILLSLESLENLLKVGEREAKDDGNQYILLVEEAKGVDRMEALQNHPNNEIYEKAASILETYFQAEEEDENTLPNIIQTNYFNFDSSNTGTNFHF